MTCPTRWAAPIYYSNGVQRGHPFAIAIVALDKDRPGILAAVTQVLLELDCNIENMTAISMRGHFAFLACVAVPPGLDNFEADLRARLPTVQLTAADVSVWKLVPTLAKPPQGDVIWARLRGRDQQGIVNALSALLARLDANILYAGATVAHERSSDPSYDVAMRAALSKGATVADVQDRLAALADDLNLEYSCELEAEIDDKKDPHPGRDLHAHIRQPPPTSFEDF
jgi:glycine cleavage system regulatory protein